MDSKFSGGVFSDELDHGRAGADIELTPSGIQATTPDGRRFVIGYRDCQVEMGGYNGRMVFCRNPERTITVFCEDRKFPAVLSAASSGTLDQQLGAGKRRVRRESRRGFMIGAVSIAGIVLLIVGCYFAVRIGARAAVHSLPIKVDEQLGKAAFQSMDLGGPELTDPVLVDAMRMLVERLQPHAAIAGMKFDVHVVKSEQMNAFCLPGGTIVVYTGLIENAEKPEQVAAVLGHEMAHATLRHGLERTSQSLGIWAAVTLLVGDAGGLIAAGADLFQFAAVNSYSREQEDAADVEGVRMMHAANMDPSSMARFFEILEEKHGDVPDMLAWISTHPQHADRIASVKALVNSLPQKDYLPVEELDWHAVKDRAAGNPDLPIGEN